MNYRKKIYPALYAWLAVNCRNIRWLSEQTGIHYHSLHDRLKGRVPMSGADLDAICAATGMSREELERR